MKKSVLFALFVLAGVSALNAQLVKSQDSGLKVNPATQTLEHQLWIMKGND